MTNGILNIHKPTGMTSHDVVARVRRILKTKRVGHAGTLDPDAVGVLVIAVGQATRLLPYLPLEPKRYIARIGFGTATSTEDASGAVIAEADTSKLTEEELQSVLPTFIGEIPQIPPMVSAVHHEGKRLYQLAREGVTVEREARKVLIHRIHASDFAAGVRAEATLDVSCGGGTYIRTLCADIGAALGFPAHMKSLLRESVGTFVLRDSISLADLETLGNRLLLSVEAALDFPKVTVSDADAIALSQGKAIAAPANFEGTLRSDSETVALLYREQLRALARFKDELFYPFRVFEAEENDGNASL